MRVVANSGPFIALARIGQEHLLPAIFQAIIVPLAVYAEIAEGDSGRAGATAYRNADWIKVVSVGDRTASAMLGDRLGRGESEAIVLSLEQNADALLIDEARGRHAAESHGIMVLGTLGILLLAKKRGLIAHIGAHMENLANNGFRMSGELMEEVLALANESV
jgi:uncharacterized protein